MKYYLFHCQYPNGEVIRHGVQAKSQSDAARLLPGHIRQDLPYLLLKVTIHLTRQSTDAYSNVRIA